jgi:coenzyme F420-0:L-glutamate ligase / coenzyme F420-1:gamma-L-glutamate ligase
MSEALHAFLRSRRSIRRFKKDPISAELLARVIETASYAPSAHNRQPWRFAVVTGKEFRTRLGEAFTKRFRQDASAQNGTTTDVQTRIDRTIRRIAEAPVLVVLCRDETAVDRQPDEATGRIEAVMGTQSVALAGLQLLLAAHAEGLGGTWICWPLFTPAETREALGLPDHWLPEGMLFLGYPDETPDAPARPNLSDICRFYR